jgi:hypothetical protein
MEDEGGRLGMGEDRDSGVEGRPAAGECRKASA